jgi:hypothetical protein
LNPQPSSDLTTRPAVMCRKNYPVRRKKIITYSKHINMTLIKQVSINSWRLLIGSRLMLSFRYDIKLKQTEQLPNVSHWQISYILLLLSFD